MIDTKLTDIQNTIKGYLSGSGSVSDYTFRCFVGMIETGEATEQDFRLVAGDDIADKVMALVGTY